MVTALAITGDDASLDGGGITFLPDITPTPKDGVQTLPNRIVRRGALAPDIRRLHLRSINVAPQHCRSARVHIAFSRERIARVLSFQNGNAGFGDTLGAVVIVTTDIRAMNSLGERNQCWVDGGIFAMSLAYALHGLGLGACMLNWSQTRERDIALREAVGIPESEAIVTMIGVGP